MNDTHTPRDVAEWMLTELQRVRYFSQDEAVEQIARLFGQRFTYDNPNGNPAIDRRVLREFRRLTGDTVVWERGERVWRLREAYDQPARQQD